MRLGVLDVGSNTVHLLVVDAHPGARPLPAWSHKTRLQLGAHLDGAGRIDAAGERALRTTVTEALDVAADRGCEDVLAFATSAIREASNGGELLDRVRTACEVDLQVLPGDDEARLTFLAVRRWFGWSSGRLLVVDVGGGSLELAVGIDEEPDVATSLPLGAHRLTRDWVAGNPPTADEVKALRTYVRSQVATVVRDLVKVGDPDLVVGTSKTMRSLARVCGAAPSSAGQYEHRWLRRETLLEWLPRLAEMTTDELAELPGVSASRAPQLLAGAIVTDAVMDLLAAESLAICPWALREGVILRRIDWLTDNFH
ncbi:MAG: Ppx/GppA family phosphatase [Streptosporangiales bacterium]|nr:Ppx/GppA family phosphatase [Streptosporangiales bacterium]